MSTSIAERRSKCDNRALQIASAVQSATGAETAILFGSRARGDHRVNSDVDILLITPSKPPPQIMERIEDMATLAQKIVLPEASGVDIGCMTHTEFKRKRSMINSLARAIAIDGVPVMPGERYHYRDEYVYDYEEDEPQIDWQDVQDRLNEALDSVNDLVRQVDENGAVHTSDRNFGFMAQRSLECSYKAVLGSHGIEYPRGGRDGHNLRRLVDLMRDEFGTPVPGEQYSYLTAFGGGGWYDHEHLPLDKPALAREIPDAVQHIIALKEEPPE